MKKNIFFIIYVFLFATIAVGQSKEEDKLSKYIENGQLEKAWNYCEKVSPNLKYSNSSNLYSKLGNAYLKSGKITEAYKCTKKTSDSFFLDKVAFEYSYDNHEPYDLDIAISLYKKSKNKRKLAKLYFYNKKDINKAIEYCIDCEKYGDILFNENRVDDAVRFYQKSKKWNEQTYSTKDTTLKEKIEYYYIDHKEYVKAYNIMSSYKVSDKKSLSLYSAHCWVAYKMFSGGEGVDDVAIFLKDIDVSDDISKKVIGLGLFKNSMFTELESYFFSIDKAEQNSYWRFVNNNLSAKTPDAYLFYAKMNKKFDEIDLMKNDLYNYVIYVIDNDYSNWRKKPIDEKLFVALKKETEKNLKNFGFDFCDFIADVVLLRAGFRVENLAGYNYNSFSEAKKTFEFVSELTIWCARNK